MIISVAAGMADSHNGSIVCVSDLESYAAKVLPKYAWEYYASGANAQVTCRNNTEALKHYSLRPRVLRSIAEPILETTIQGEKIPFPICISPTSMHCLAHPDGELATAKASAAYGTCMCLSATSNKSIEAVYSAATIQSNHPLLWFQVYIFTNWEITKNLVQRVEKSGYKAIVITVDSNVIGIRYSDQRNNFSLPPHLALDSFIGLDDSIAYFNRNKSVRSFSKAAYKVSIGWDIIPRLRSITSLPIILKSIQTPEDALLAVKHGADGIWVSNHGGRQLDTVDASIEMLEEICDALGSTKIEVYFDGGVRYGSDVLKALALGARAVFIGRPVLWGLAYDGEAGVKLVFEMLRKELEVAMLLAGVADVKCVDRKLVRKKCYFSPSKL